MKWLDSITDARNMNLGKLQETGRPGVLPSMASQRVGDRTTGSFVSVLPSDVNDVILIFYLRLI